MVHTQGVHARKLELVVRNDEANAARALQVDQQLIEENVVAIIGHVLSQMVAVVLEEMNRTSTLMMKQMQHFLKR